MRKGIPISIDFYRAYKNAFVLSYYKQYIGFLSIWVLQFSHAEMIVEDDRGSLLTKGSLYNRFYRADARHEISCRKAHIFVSQSVQSGSL